MEFLRLWADATTELWLETAPWLLVGLFVAGLVHRLLNTSWVAKRLGKDAKHPVLLASVLGTPLPLCSCSVLPTAQALREGGASRGATAAFLVATPETGPDSVGITFGLFDPVFAILRPISAWWSAVVTGIWVDKSGAPENTIEGDQAESAPNGMPPGMGATGDGATGPEATGALAADSACEHDHHHDHHHDHGVPAGPKPTWRETLQYVLGPLWDDLAPPLTLGFLLAGLLAALLPADLIAEWVPAGILGLALVGLLGVPLSICASASTPLAATLVDKGLSPGAALVLLLTGPATNLATLGVVRNILGSKALWAYLLGIFSSALAAGLFIDALYAYTGRDLRRGAADWAEHGHGPWVQAAAVLLLALFLVYWVRRFWAKAPLKPT